jgi:nitrate/nitrite-specific signal transduction histidine kinase
MDKPKIGRQKGERGKASAELAALLNERREEIATAWAEMVRALPGSPYGELPPEEVRSLTLRGVEAIAESLETGSRTVLDDYLSHICPATSEAIPDACTVTEALLLCKDAALPIIQDGCGPGSSETWALISELDSLLRCMVARLTSMCTAEMARQLEKQRAQVATLLDMARTVSSTLELDAVVSRASEQIAAVLGTDGCFFALVNEEQRSTVYLPEPSDWSSRRNLAFEDYASVFHELLLTRLPVASYDVSSDPRVTVEPEFEGAVKSMLAVPLTVNGKVVATAGSYTVHDYRRFSKEEIALAQGMGNMLGLVIRNAQLYEQSKLLTVMEERARLSREMHDGISQTLGALQLKASQLEDSLARRQVDESEGYLCELQDMISRAYRDLREAMLGLRAVVDPGAGLVAALREYLAYYRAQCGMDVGLEASEDEQATLDGETQAQAMRIVQEALSNVRRHSGTNSATVRVERAGDAVRIIIADEGQGFDGAIAERSNDGRHLGLLIMRERADSIGGTLAVESLGGRGTRVVLDLPLSGGERAG